MEAKAKAIRSFRELQVYALAFGLQQEIFLVTQSFPREETYSLTDQMRRAARSIGANLAEAWQKRRYEAHFVSKLTDADAEQAELQHWIETALACGYLQSDMHKALLAKCLSVGRMLGSMIKSADKFCHRSHSPEE